MGDVVTAPLAMPDAHARSIAEVVEQLGVDPVAGLESDDAAARLAQYGANELDRTPPVGWLERILREFRNPLVLLLLVAVVVSLTAWILEGGEGLPYDAIAITAIVTVNGAIGAVQGFRADSAAAALEELASTHSTVMRSGRAERVPTREVVVGDIVQLATGDAVPADARIIENHSLMTAEAALTGESLAVDKSTEPVAADAYLGDRSGMVYSGTSVVSGRGSAVVVATGMGTEVGHIASMLGGTDQTETPLQLEIEKLGRLLGGLVIAIAIVVMAVLFITSDVDSLEEVIDVLLVGVSLAVAAVPEGLPAVLSVVLAISVQRMAARNALVKRLLSAETLGSATVICTDKTGTLTRSEMTVRVAVVGSTHVDIGGVGYEPAGDVTLNGEAAPPAVFDAVRTLLDAAVVAGDSDIESTPEGWKPIGNPTEAALVAARAKLGDSAAAPPAPPRVGEIGFTSDRKRMTVLVEGPDGATTAITKGAPDVLLARCSGEAVDGSVVPLSPERRTWWSDQVDVLANDGLRTLAVGRRSGVRAPLEEDDETELEWLGLVGIDDPPRDEAAASVTAAHDSGIRVVMITGDHRGTATRIAQQVGIGRSGAAVVTGAEVDAMDDSQLAEVATGASVFARATPEHKIRLVRALQEQGEVVAMTGDGVNDAPALKAADLGTAMGVAGTDVAREASDLILLDDNFATIVAAVSEGRTIWRNIQSFLRYLLSSNIGEVFTVFFGIVLAGLIGLTGDGILVPLTASQILWINLLTDAAPALALGVDPVDPRVMQSPPRQRTQRLVDAAMRNGVLIVGATMAVVTLLMFDLQHPGGLIEGSNDVTYSRTAGFTVLVFAQIFNAFSARSDLISAFSGWARNRMLLWASLLAVVLQIAVVHVPALNDAFSTSPLELSDWILSAVLASAVLWVAEVRKAIRRRRVTPARTRWRRPSSRCRPAAGGTA